MAEEPCPCRALPTCRLRRLGLRPSEEGACLLWSWCQQRREREIERALDKGWL